MLAVGESQSAVALTTYYNGVQPIADAFDGFLVHSRGSVALPLVGPGEHADLADSIGGGAVLLRDDLDVPALVLQAEGDVIGVLSSYSVRQDDTDTYRLWEVAGTAHADTRLVGATAEQLDCGAPVNDGPMHVVAKAALRALEEWVRTGEAPRRRRRGWRRRGDPPAIVRDADGIARGGVRTPPVDVPVVVLSGASAARTRSLICILLMGSTTPLPDERLRELYEIARRLRAPVRGRARPRGRGGVRARGGPRRAARARRSRARPRVSPRAAQAGTGSASAARYSSHPSAGRRNPSPTSATIAAPHASTKSWFVG
ncbi:MAG: hypothetical protein KatS3mg010_0122 [Acidimicrobiia bacterium]|nr:MAG: hypothetical protein KatS3mg010_0122 [Acidimicrobiia bacterium]